jgi:hypothetical protein
MKKIYLVFAVMLFATYDSQAQGVEKKMGTSAGASQIYLELGGSGIVYTLNFDTRFNKRENGLGFRIGAGGAGGNDGGYFAIPAQLNYLLGENGKYLELGGGITYIKTEDDDFFFDETSTVAANLVVGFRSQPFAKKGLTWRIAFTPFIGGGGFLPWGGASIGFRF